MPVCPVWPARHVGRYGPAVAGLPSRASRGQSARSGQSRAVGHVINAMV